MEKKTKIAVAVVVVIVVGIIIYMVTKGTGTWKEIKQGDINGGQYDIEVSPSGTLEQDKAHANKIGAKAFMRREGQTYYKNAASPVTTVNIGVPQTLYVKE